ncbi:MAG: hypothetical protein IKA74_00580 [Clostridia bacterium]|nr:hypothetical protein [Clostridia bacterium]
MKKRILSIVLAMVMIATLIPAVALVSFAETTDEVVKDFAHYEKLWYDDGHLVSFVDLTHLTAEDEVYGGSADISSAPRVIEYAASYKSGSARRSYIKIAGGDMKDKYYPIAYSQGVNPAEDNFLIDENGNLTFPLSAYSQFGNGVKSGIYVGRAVTIDEASVAYTSAADVIGAGDTVFTPSETQLADGTYGSLTLESVLSVAVPDGVTQNHFTAFSSTQGTAASGNDVVVAGTKYDGGYFKYLYTGYASSTTPVNLGTSYGISVASHITFEGTNAVSSATFLANGAIYTANVPTNTKSYNTYELYNAKTLNAGSPNGAQMYFVRLYDETIGAEQLRRNHFADLAYYYGLDYAGGDFEVYFDAGLVGDDFYAQFSAYQVGMASEDDVIAMQELIDGYTVSIDYSDFYYNDGHLEAFVDLTGLTASDVVNASSTANVTEDTRVFYHATAYSGGAARRSYVKISGGNMKDKYFLLVIASQTHGLDGSFTVDEDGVLVFANSDGQYYFSGTMTDMYFQMGNSGHAGVYIGRAFTYYEALNTTSWNGVETAITADTAGDWAKAVAGNSFTIETTVKMATNFGSKAVQGHFNRFAGIGAQNTLSGIHGNVSGDSYVYDYLTLGYAGQGKKVGNLSSNASPNTYAQVASTVTFDETYGFYGADYLIGGALYSGAYTPPTDGSAINAQVCYTHDALKAHTAYAAAVYGSQLRYVRVYDIDLGEAEMLQNHFVDLCNHNKVSAATMIKFKGLSEGEKDAIYAWSKTVQMDDANVAEQISDKIDEIAAQRAVVEAAAAQALNFVGFQARLHTNVGVRSVFKLDASMLSDYAVVAYGALVGEAKVGADFDTYTVSYDGEKVTSKNAAITCSLDTENFKTIDGAEKEFILGKNNSSTLFAYTVDFIENGTIAKDGTVSAGAINHIADEKDTEMFFRAFIIVEANGISYTVYVDGASANYNNTSVSLTEISEYYVAYNNGEFANNVCIKAVVGNSDEE